MCTCTQGIILHSEPCASGSEILGLMSILNPFLSTSHSRRRKLFQIKRATRMKKKGHIWAGCDYSTVQSAVQDGVKDALFCKACCLFDEALDEVPYHYGLWSYLLAELQAKFLLGNACLAHSCTPPRHSALSIPFSALHPRKTDCTASPMQNSYVWSQTWLGFNSKGRDFPLPFGLWNNLFKERYQDSNVNYFIILEVRIREKKIMQTWGKILIRPYKTNSVTLK